MGQKYLIDTCAVVKYLSEQLPEHAMSFMDNVVDEDCRLSFITKIELLVWNAPDPIEIEIRKEFISGATVYYINASVINQAIKIRKDTNIKLPDAIIAATAMIYNCTLLSDNDIDFNKVIPLGLNYLNPRTAFV